MFCLQICYVYYMCVSCPRWPEEGVRSFETRVTGVLGTKTRTGSMQEQQALLTAELTLQPIYFYLWF